MEKQKLLKIIENFKDKKILVIGDIILDHYIFGNIQRISQEAPVPIIGFDSEEYLLGGAANTAANIASLSGNPTLLGFIGQDKNGKRLIQLAKKQGMNFIPSYVSETIEKTRIISENQQLLRIDKENKYPKYFNQELVLQELEKTDLIIISDYAKGAITRTLMELISNKGKMIIIDPKPSNKIFYKDVFLITPNKKEALEMSNCSNVNDAGEKLKQELSTNVIITQGKQGMTIFNKGIRNIPTYAKEVYDVTGAGDTVIATIGLALATGADLEQAAILANHAAGIVVAKPRTAKATLSELKTELSQENQKIKTFEELQEISINHHNQKKKLVWTNGCFDILHQGHVDYLKKAKQAGDYLIVGLNSDESVRKFKGPNRPVQKEEARAEIISALQFVDYVVIFQEQSPKKYLEILKPDVYAKGGDYNIDTINQEERKIIENYGGEIILIPSSDNNMSTTKIIEKTKELGSKK